MSLLYRVFNTITRNYELAPAPNAPALWEQELPSGAIDGVNKDFVLSKTPASKKTTIVFVNSRPLPLTEWDMIGNKIILNSAPEITQTVYVFYMCA